MFTKTAFAAIATILVQGCGNTTTKPDNQVTPAPEILNKGNGGGSQGVTEEPIKVKTAEDRACEKAMRQIPGIRGKTTYCKENNGDRVCQWLYVNEEGVVHQTSDESIDTVNGVVPLSCERAMGMFGGK